MFSLLRHFFAGSIEAKVWLALGFLTPNDQPFHVQESGATRNLQQVFYDIFHLKDCNELLRLETLCCFRNSIANCATSKKMLLNLLRTSKAPMGMPECILRLAKTNAYHEEILLACFEILKVFALHAETRTAMIKVRKRFCTKLA
jgi:hypothetical protein